MLPDPPDEARRWLDQALEDLRAACRLAEDPTIPDRLAAFLAHLVAEKALKGVLIAWGTAVRRIYDLVALQAMLDPRDGVAIDSDDVDTLTPWNIEGRYPVDPDQDATPPRGPCQHQNVWSMRSAARSCATLTRSSHLIRQSVQPVTDTVRAAPAS